MRRYQNETFKLANPPYGYDWDGKTLVINEDQAQHVRWIFAQALAGVPLTKIAKEMIKSDQISSAGIFCASSSAVHAGGSERQVFRWREIRLADFL